MKGFTAYMYELSHNSSMPSIHCLLYLDHFSFFFYLCAKSFKLGLIKSQEKLKVTWLEGGRFTARVICSQYEIDKWLLTVITVEKFQTRY